MTARFGLMSWRDLFRLAHRRWLYAGLFATMAVLIASIVGGARRDSVGFGHGIAWYEYLYSQAWAISRYLQLTLWPDRLAFDYGASPIHGLRGVPGLIVLSAAAIATAFAWKRAAWVAFLGTWFFMLLAPSSSIVPIQTEIAAERRIYLALVPVLILTVVGIEALRHQIAGQSAERRRSTLVVFMAIVGVAYFVSCAWTGTLVASRVRLVPVVGLIARVVVACVAASVAWQLVVAKDRRPVARGVARRVDAAVSAPEPGVCRRGRTVARRGGEGPRKPACVRQPRGGDYSERLIADGRRRTGATHGDRDRFHVPHGLDESRGRRAQTRAYD